jgi:regulatory protein YycI of two-component signal transduction system YycFG
MGKRMNMHRLGMSAALVMTVDQTPPVDLSTQMILQTYVENDCFGNSSFQQVCEDSDQVTVTLFQSSENYGCNLHAYMWISAAVDRTDKPVVWQVVSP